MTTAATDSADMPATFGDLTNKTLVRVDDGGRVRDAGVHSSSGTRSLDQAALAAVRRWKFRPALRGNRPVEHAVLVPVSFRIER